MKPGWTAATALFLWLLALPASAHRLDELLQAATLAVAKDRVTVQLRLTPGVAVVPAVLADLDADGNGILSPAEQRAYVARVLRDLSLTVDDHPLPLRLLSTAFPGVGEMRAGLGEILLTFDAPVPPGGLTRRLVFQNHYQRKFAAYLVNCLSSADSPFRVIAQNRNDEQSFYQLDYALTAVDPNPVASAADGVSRP